MIRTAEQLSKLPEGEHKCVSIRTALPAPPGGAPGSAGRSDVKFLDHLQKKYSHQVGFLPMCALEAYIERGHVSIALENDEPAAYLLGKGNYLNDPHFGIIYQAAVSYDARRRLLGTALVQHFLDHIEPGPAGGNGGVRLIGLWCAQDIEANEFWSACGFEPIAARHGSKRKGRVHIFWVGRTPLGKNEPMSYPKSTRGGLMRAKREVYGLKPGEKYKEVVLPPEVETGPQVHRSTSPQRSPSRGRRANGGQRTASLLDMQRAFRYGHSQHICVVVNGATLYLPVAPIDVPDFVDVARTIVGV